MRVDRGGTQGFQGRPPTKPLVTTGGFPLLRDVTLLNYGAGKGFGFSGFPRRGRKLPFSLISGAETRKIPGGLEGRERDFAKCRQLHLYIARMFEL